MKRLIVIIFFSYSIHSTAQYLPLSNDIDWSYGKYFYNKNLSGHTSLKPYYIQPSDSLFEDTIAGIRGKKSWLKRKLFQDHLFEFKADDYKVNLDVLPDMYVGYDQDNSKFVWNNTRIFHVDGQIARGLSFSSDFYETQTILPNYLDSLTQKTETMLGQGPYKQLKDVDGGFDYTYATAHIAYRVNQFLLFQLGNDKNFIGDGYRSFILSDVSIPYPFFKVSAHIGNVQYSAIYAQFLDPKAPKLSPELSYRKKYATFHYLDWNVTSRFSLGFFDAVVWQADDSAGHRGFEWSYLNPIIFLRPVEYSFGSSDNALLGLNTKFKIGHYSVLYGQLMLDEFKFSELKANKGWWANKFAIQAGLRSFDLFHLKNLNGLVEFNMAKPYMYSQRNSLKSYGNYNEPLAHPAGANFWEALAILNYRYKRLDITAKVNYTCFGIDSANNLNNVGQDIFKSYDTRDADYGNKIVQGRKATLLYTDLRLSYRLNPKNNLRIELGIVQRNDSVENTTSNDTVFTFGIRSSFRNFYYDR